ncbi:MAG: C40 family peptidase [Treponema sp.]|nr:C40 family peptidase [Treponema sp.]
MKLNRIFFAAAMLLLTVVFAQTLTAADKVSAERQRLIDYALSLKGTPYVYSGKTPESGFDCSGFVSYAASHAVNVQIPPTSQAIYTHRNVKLIEEDEREPGDLMFFKTTGTGKVSHVGIYLGKYNGKGKFHGKRLFIHAASDGPETGVIISAIDEKYWQSHFCGYGRILPPTK